MTSETSSSILKSARRLFSQQGYTATAMHEIAAEAGIGKATIYHHFRSKEEIILRLVRDSMENLHEAVKPIEQTEDPRELFRLAALRAITFLYNSTDILQIARREVPGVRELMTDKLVVFFNDFSALLEENLRRGMRMGIFRPLDPHETAAVFITMIQGNFARFFLTRMRPGTPEESTEALLKVFFHGITAVPAGQTDAEKD